MLMQIVQKLDKLPLEEISGDALARRCNRCRKRLRTPTGCLKNVDTTIVPETA